MKSIGLWCWLITGHHDKILGSVTLDTGVEYTFFRCERCRAIRME